MPFSEQWGIEKACERRYSAKDGEYLWIKTIPHGQVGLEFLAREELLEA